MIEDLFKYFDIKYVQRLEAKKKRPAGKWQTSF